MAPLNLLRFSFVLAALTIVTGCRPITLTQVQQRFDESYAGGCVLPPQSGGTGAIQVIGYRAAVDANNLIYSIHSDTDESYNEGLFQLYSIPGVPVGVSKCMNDFGIVEKIAVATADGQAYIVDLDLKNGGVMAIGASNILTVRGVEFAEQDGSGLKNLIVYGTGGGPFSSMAVYVEQNDGTYASPNFPSGLGTVTSVAAANLDGTAGDELAVAQDTGGQNLGLYSFDGPTGTYSPYAGYSTGGVASRVAAADLDDDGVSEIVVLNQSPGVNGNTVGVYQSNGDGTVGLIDLEPVANGPTHVAFGDVNFDGHLDAAVACGTVDEISMLFGAPGGVFAGSTQHLSPDGVGDLVFVPSVPEVPGSPTLDLLVLSSFEQVAVLMRGDGEDLLTEQFEEFVLTSDMLCFVAANFDSSPDGVPEMRALVVDDDGSTRQLYRADWDAANGTFGDSSLELDLSANEAMAVGDFDGANGPDLVTGSTGGGAFHLRNDGAGNLALVDDGLAPGAFITAIGAMSINGDATDDVVVLAQNTLTTWFAFADGPWQEGSSISAPGTTLAVGRYDDGSNWVATAHRALDDVSFWNIMPDGSMVLSDTVSIAGLNNPEQLASGDWDGDGHDDAVIVLSENLSADVQVVLMLNDGVGGFDSQVIFDRARVDGWNPIGAGFADVNGDGRTDVVCVNNSFNASDQFLFAIVNDPKRGTEPVIEMYLTGDPIGCFVVADLDGDDSTWFLTGKTGSRKGLSALPTRSAVKGGPCNEADIVKPFGQLDFADLQAFLNLFAEFDLSVDLNGDGALDFFDVQRYLGSFSAGCP